MCACLTENASFPEGVSVFQVTECLSLILWVGGNAHVCRQLAYSVSDSSHRDRCGDWLSSSHLQGCSCHIFLVSGVSSTWSGHKPLCNPWPQAFVLRSIKSFEFHLQMFSCIYTSHPLPFSALWHKSLSPLSSLTAIALDSDCSHHFPFNLSVCVSEEW